MGRQIPTDRPLSDEDRAFLKMWSREEEIVKHDELFPPGSKPSKAAPAAKTVVPDPDISMDDEGVDVDVDISEWAEGLKVAELKAALLEHGIDFDRSVHRDELVATLAIGLQDKRDSGETVTVPGE